MIPLLAELRKDVNIDPFVRLFVWHYDYNWINAQRAFNEVWGAERAYWESRNESLSDARITSIVINKLYVDLVVEWAKQMAIGPGTPIR